MTELISRRSVKEIATFGQNSGDFLKCNYARHATLFTLHCTLRLLFTLAVPNAFVKMDTPGKAAPPLPLCHSDGYVL